MILDDRLTARSTSRSPPIATRAGAKMNCEQPLSCWRRNRNRNCPRLPMSRARQGGWRGALNSHHASQRRSSDWIVGVRRVRL
jgi:hypothetical protein